MVALTAVRASCLLCVAAVLSACGTSLAGNHASLASPKLAATEKRFVRHKVKKGETLWRISRRYHTTVDRLLALNRMNRPEELRTGAIIQVPVGSPAPKASRTTGKNQQRPSAPRKPRSKTGYPFLWPVDGKVKARFVKRGDKPHDGVDIHAPYGTRVHAVADGEVLHTAAQGGYGNLVLLRHRSGLITVYAHNSVNLVRKGQWVKAGQPIARVGKSGRARTPHLHFEVRQGIRPEDPLRYLPP